MLKDEPAQTTSQTARAADAWQAILPVSETRYQGSWSGHRSRLCLLLLAVAAMMPQAGGLAGSFEFVVIGDTRPRFESEDFRVFEGLLHKINEAKPALVINLGDLI
jgi:hypothetical protein